VVLLATGHLDTADALRRQKSDAPDIVASRPMREPFVAIVSLRAQRVTIFDAEGSVLHAPVSTGQAGRETPAGIYSVLQKEEFHTSNLYDDAEMPFMQRLTWSGIALHAGHLPGYPASHGCIRMPYEFAQRLFDLTPVGMRVIVAPNDVRPAEIDHPALFKRATPQPTWRAIAAAKEVEAREAARRANASRLAAARLKAEAARVVPVAMGAKQRAEARLVTAEAALGAARSPEAARLADDVRARARANLAEAEAQVLAAEVAAPLKAKAALRARDDASAAEAERLAASEAGREATRRMAPVSVLISRKTERLYVRQAFREVLEAPITIRDAADPIGTHIYTALDTTDGGADLRWNVVTVSGTAATRQARRRGDDTYGVGAAETSPAGAALGRIEMPRDVADRITEMMSPGSSLIISDEGPSAETGKDTDFVIVMSGEPQGAIKKRRRTPQAHTREALSYDRSSSRSSANRPPLYWEDTYGRW
jgi:hypothetical protein